MAEPRALGQVDVDGLHTAPSAPGSTQGAYGVLARRVAALAPQEWEVLALGCWAMVHGLATLSMDEAVALDDDVLRNVLSAMTKTLLSV